LSGSWAFALRRLATLLAHLPQGPYGTTLPNEELWDAHIRPPSRRG
jgi:hypothetical protein